MCPTSAFDTFNYIRTQIKWCLREYAGESVETLSMEELVEKYSGTDESFLPDWSSFRVLQNRLFRVISESDAEFEVALSSLLITILDRGFSDLCSDTPWDEEQLINSARRRFNTILLAFLCKVESCIQEGEDEQRADIWKSFVLFEFEYNKIINFINKEDQKLLNSWNSDIPQTK